MWEVVIELLKDKKALVIILAALFVAPCYMAYRIESAVNNLANRLECGAKIHVSSIANAEPAKETQ